MVLKIMVTPTGMVSFRKPSGFGGLAHGPGTAGDSLGYPLPSTLAGVVASIAYQRNQCRPSPGVNEWDDTRECLRSLLGEGAKLYAGFAAIQGEPDIRYYTPLGYARREALSRYHKCIADSEVKDCHKILERDAVREPVLEYTGIALQRQSKTVLPEHLYTTRLLDPSTIKLSYIIMVEDALIDQGINRLPVKFGADAKTAIIHTVKDTGKPLLNHLILEDSSDCTEWIIQLVTPALLGKSPWSEGTPIKLSGNFANELAGLLIPGNNTGKKPTTKRIIVPRTDPPITILAPGWSIASNKPRKPYLFVPPGTLLQIEAEKKVIEELVASGLGLHTDLGWGTITATCIG